MLDEIYDKDELRRTVSVASVATALGIHVDSSGLAVCPFHDDHTPSLSVYVTDDGVQRWGCFPCGARGDAFDLVQRVRDCSFGDAVRFVSRVGATAPALTVRPKAELDYDALVTYVNGAQKRAALERNEGLLCVAARLTSNADAGYDATLRRFGWGVDDSANVVIPHWGRDYRMTGCKIRGLDGAKWSFPGSSFPDLYGAWMSTAPGWTRLLLTEGETDLVHAFRQAGQSVVVRALPRGATGFHQRWADWAARFDVVYLGFDADDAGDAATLLWQTGMRAVDFKGGLRVLPVPRGEDLRSCGIGVQDLMDHADADAV